MVIRTNSDFFIKDLCSKYSIDEYDKYIMKEYLVSDEFINKRKIAVIDCDGIITNSKSYYTKESKTFKCYGAYDKEMLKLLSKYNWSFIFVSDDKKGLEITKTRIKDLMTSIEGIRLENYNSKERNELVLKLKEEYDLVVFIGDSISDIPSLINAHIGATVNNAPDVVKNFSKLVTDKNGAEGGLADILYNIHIKNAEI